MRITLAVAVSITLRLPSRRLEVTATSPCGRIAMRKGKRPVSTVSRTCIVTGSSAKA